MAETVLSCPGPVPCVPLGFSGLVEVLLALLSTALLLSYMLLDATYRILLTLSVLVALNEQCFNSISAASAAFGFN